MAPEGANAFEFYLSVLQLDPANAVAHEHLDELFPRPGEVEQAINAKELDEATRELRLLREVDSNNYTLSLLAGKLDAQRMIKVREDEAAGRAMRANAEASASANAEQALSKQRTGAPAQQRDQLRLHAS